MRIGVDSRPLCEPKTSGIPLYVRSVLHELATRDNDNAYILYAHRDFHFDFPPHWAKRTGARTRYGSVWVQTELPFWLKKDRIDLFWGTEHILPIFLPTSVKTVLTVCDLVHTLYPDTMSPLNFLINKLLLSPSVRRADAIITISHATLADLQTHMRPSTDLVRAVHLGVSDAFSPRDPTRAQEKVERCFPGLHPYILTVGTFEPRKNVAGLVRAFLRVADRVPHTLAIAGQQGWKNASVLDAIERSGKKERIRLLGYVPDEVLPDLYAGAAVFAFPSLYEGFGLPPLEAMAAGVPVVCSNRSSLPEVVGEAALLVDPHDTEAIAHALLQVIENPPLRQDLISRGLAQAAKFRWAKTAEAIQDIFALVAKHGG